MKIRQTFTVSRPRDEVWDLFQDIPALVDCMPGAELTADKGGGLYTGKVSIRIGPFSAAFEGEGQHTPDPTEFTGEVVGRGIDKRGGSRTQMTMTYSLADNGRNTDVSMEADVQLAGPIAQFGRVGVITETANLLIGQFVDNVEKRLQGDAGHGHASGEERPSGAAAERPSGGNEINALALLLALVKNFFKRLVGKPG